MATGAIHRRHFPRVILPSLALLALLALAKAGMYGAHVTELTESNFDSEVINSAETWVVKFYAPWCGHCKSSAPAFSKAAKRLHGVARLGVVNCDDHGSLAQRFGVTGFPTIKTFAGEGRRARRPSDYNGDRSAGAISRHARNIQPSFVARVMSDGVDSFFNDLPKLAHILLFTDKTETSGLYKGIAARFRKSLAFGEARKKEASAAAERFGVTAFPTILVFPPGKSAIEDAVQYSGAMNPDALISHFSIVTKEGAGAAGEGTAEDTPEEKKKPVFAQPKAYDGEVQSIASKAEYVDKCGARNDGRLCILGLLPGAETHALKLALAEAAKGYLYDNLAFAIIDTNEEKGKAFASVFGDAMFVAVRARKGKFSAMPKTDAEIDITAVTGFVDRIVGGEVRYSKLDELPAWEAEKKEETETEQKGEQAQGKSNATKEADAGEGQCGTEPPKDGGSCSAPDAGTAGADAGTTGKTDL